MGLRDSEERLMQQFFTEPSLIRDGKIYIEGTDLGHMKNVLRMKPGEKVRVSDGRGKNYLCSIAGYEGTMPPQKERIRIPFSAIIRS